MQSLAHIIRCSNCNGETEGLGRYCRKCHAAYMRVWRQRRRSAMAPDERRKDNARAKANAHYGAWKNPPCERCGATKTEKHHRDYNKPLEVVFLCRPCHMREHGQRPRSTQLSRLIKQWTHASEMTRKAFLAYVQRSGGA